MGTLSYEMTNPERRASVLLYGPAKTRKTVWAGAAAAAGLDVFFLDGDRGGEVLMQLPPELRSKVNVINAWDDQGKANFQSFIGSFVQGEPFYWNDTRRVSEIYLGQKFAESDAYWYIKPRETNQSQLVVLDSWTKLCISIVMNYALTNKINIADPKQLESDKWKYYRHAGTIADFALNQFFGMHCHFACIAHQTVYEKKTEDEEGKSVTEYSRIQPVSVSGPNAMKMAATFDHVLQFSVNPFGDTMIDVRSNSSADGGSRSIPPKVYMMKDLSFATILQHSRIQVGQIPSDAFTFYPPGEVNKHTEVNKRAMLSGGKVGQQLAQSPIPAGSPVKATVVSGRPAPLNLANLGVK